MATERSLERCGVDSFDLLLLHNPDRTGYTSEAVWDALEAVQAAGLTRMLGVAPGPANGFTLDVIDCLERFGDRIDWAMVILNPLEPWPGELVLPAAERHGVKLITRVVDYGGLFHDDVLPGHEFPRYDHRGFRPAGWVEAGRAKFEAMRPIAERHGLTMLQLACHWNLAHGPVHCVAPTLISEPGSAKSIEAKRAELAAVRGPSVLSAEEVAEIRAIGDNRGSMLLKGAAPGLRGRAAARSLAAHPGADRARGPLGHRARARPDQSRLRASVPRVDHRGTMIRLPAIGAAVFALVHARAADVRRPAQGPEPADAPRHAQPAAGRQPRRGRHDRPGRRRRRHRRPADHVVRQRDRRRQRRPSRRPAKAAVQGRLRLRRRPPEPLRRLEGRAAGQRRDRPALPVGPGRRHQGPALRHGHRLRPAVRGHPVRPAAGRPRRLRRQLLRDLQRRPARPRRRGRAAQRDRARRRPLRLRAGVRPGRDRDGLRPASARARRTSTTAAA